MNNQTGAVLFMKKVLVVFGGESSEHDVSLVSAKSIVENMPSDAYETLCMGITKDGRWYLYSGSIENLPEDKWLSDTSCLSEAVISPSKADHGIICIKDGNAKKIYIDVVFPVLHGKNGEDGTIQGLLELSGIPFVGCGVLSSAAGMDKAVTNALADLAGVPQAAWLCATHKEYNDAPQVFEDRCAQKLGFPCFVKPANAGSSVGISKAHDKYELHDAIKTAFESDSKIVVEEGIDGIEVECAVLGNDEVVAPVVGEVTPCNEFYDFDAKYAGEGSRITIPSGIPQEKQEEVSRLAKKMFSVLGCTGLSRVDFFVRRSDSAVLFNEINTMPGFTSISMYPKMLMHAGLSYKQIIRSLLDLAQEKGQKE